MWIINIETNQYGAHDNHGGDHIVSVPEGWAIIPDDMVRPDSFPFVFLETEMVTHQMGERTFTAMTVTKMTPGVLPPTTEPEPTWQERIEAQITYTAMMTDSLLGV